MKNVLFFLISSLFVHSLSAQQRVVILGSSTSEGTGPKSKDSAWVNIFSSRIGASHQATVVNLAKGGYNSYQIMPAGYEAPAGRSVPDTARNIDKALSLGADMLIINMPSNDVVMGYTNEEYMENMRQLFKIAGEHNIICFITTTQPRSEFDLAERRQLIQLRDLIKKAYPKQYIDFWSGFSTKDGKILPQYDCGDGIHLNGKGHLLLVKVVFRELEKRNIYSKKRS